MKFLYVCLCLSLQLFSNEQIDVDIKADNFEADQKKNIVIFTGNVKMHKGEDYLTSNKLDVFTKQDENNQSVIKKYIATGNVDLKLKKPTTVLIGRGDMIIYDVDMGKYIIEGNGYLEDINESKIIKGEKIFIDEKTSYIKIDGKEDKPVEFKFKMDSKK